MQVDDFPHDPLLDPGQELGLTSRLDQHALQFLSADRQQLSPSARRRFRRVLAERVAHGSTQFPAHEQGHDPGVDQIFGDGVAAAEYLIEAVVVGSG